MRSSSTGQLKPDFSGKWKLLAENGAAPPPPALVPKPDLTITQTADTFTTEEPAGGRTVTVTYKLDGTEMKQTINRADVATKARWDGDALVTTVTGQAANWQDVWRLTGDRLSIETTMPGRAIATSKRFERF